MKKIHLMSVVAACATVPVFAAAPAAVFGDTPNAKHAWSVHDRNRPNPVKISAEAGNIPSDAIVLFDGSKESFEKNWCDKDGKPSKWSLGTENDFYSVPGWKNGGNIFSRQSFGDCQLHIEFRHPKEEGIEAGPKGPQMHGNSGVFLMSKYEVQVLESFGTDPAKMKNPNYADGQAGAIYAQTPPMVNPARRPGEWQTYDIIFHQPVWDGLKLLHPASITVLFNGVVVQDHWVFIFVGGTKNRYDFFFRGKGDRTRDLCPALLHRFYDTVCRFVYEFVVVRRQLDSDFLNCHLCYSFYCLY